MTDRFTEATAELERKNAYLCQSCGSSTLRTKGVAEAQRGPKEEYLDRYSAAEAELEEKNAFVYENWGSGAIGPPPKSGMKSPEGRTRH